MKKSTKIIVIAFLSLLFFISAVHISLSARYKSGEYTAYTGEADNRQKTAYPGVKQIVLKNLGDVTMQVGDTASVSASDGGSEEYSITQQGDKLYITATKPKAIDGRYRGQLRVTIPVGATITATYTDILVQQKQGNNGTGFNAVLDSSRLAMSQARTTMNFDSVSIQAVNHSNIKLRKTNIASLNVLLRQSSIDEKESELGSVQLNVDSSSELSLSSRNLVKAKINTAAQE